MGGYKATGGGGSNRPMIIGRTTCFAAFYFFGSCGSCTKSSLLLSTMLRFLQDGVELFPVSSSSIFRRDCGEELPNVQSATAFLTRSSCSPLHHGSQLRRDAAT